jgi:exodeoxyribonuclease VII large subunit
MIRVARNRWPAIGITLAPAQVQGESAAEDIAAALSAMVSQGRVDLIIVGRGGGSVEDLWAFNEEAVVRAIASSSIPTISAVGHETDFTLSDLAADHRAPTPTAAAQMAVPDRTEVGERISGLVLRARRAERHHRETLRREFRILAGALVDPRPLLQARRYALAKSMDALAERMQEISRRSRERVSDLATALRLGSPSAWVSRKRGEIAVLLERAVRRMDAGRAGCRGRIDVCGGKLAALDPTAVLSRGYAIATARSSGRAVRTVSEATPGAVLDVRVSDGVFGAIVEGEKG